MKRPSAKPSRMTQAKASTSKRKRRVKPASPEVLVSSEDAAKLLGAFAVDIALGRYMVKLSARGKTITFVLTERRK